jgi:glycosyltransferase involved in cell wall biosynthesis
MRAHDESAAVNPQVSIIMPAFNAAQFLDEAVESIIRQRFEDWELICVDDCSTDDTRTRLEGWAFRDQRIRVYSTPVNSGVGGARDRGIRYARGRYVAMMDSDDVAMPDRLERQVAYLGSHPEVIALGTQTIQVNEMGEEIGRKKFPCDAATLYDMLYTAAPIQVPTLIVDRAKLPAEFDWFACERYAEDTLLFFKLLQYGSFANLPEFLQLYRYYPSSLSSSHSKEIFFATYRARSLGRRRYGYRARWQSRLVSELQWVVVSVLPNRLIPGFYRRTRGVMLWLSGRGWTPSAS